jgi:hypothetical protein
MRCCWKNKNWTEDHANYMNGLYEAKRQCMVTNNVKILKSTDYEIYLKYVAKKYGRKFIASCKKS